MSLFVQNTLIINLVLLKQIFGFIYLTFLPGILFIRYLNIISDDVKSCLIIIGTSLSLLMLFGATLNFLGPYLDISRPLSQIPIIFGLFSIILFLIILNAKNNLLTKARLPLDLSIFHPRVLIFVALPELSIFGTYLVNISKNNFILLFMIALICLIILIVGFTDRVPKEHYAFIILMIAISLLFHNTLISDYIWGWDIQGEYALLSNVIQDSYWNSTKEGSLTGMLSITVLPTIYENVLGN